MSESRLPWGTLQFAPVARRVMAEALDHGMDDERARAVTVQALKNSWPHLDADRARRLAEHVAESKRREA